MDDLGLPKTGGINQWTIRKLVVFRIWYHPFLGVHKLSIWWARSERTSAWLSTNEEYLWCQNSSKDSIPLNSWLGANISDHCLDILDISIWFGTSIWKTVASLRMFVLFVGIRVPASPQWHQSKPETGIISCGQSSGKPIKGGDGLYIILYYGDFWDGLGFRVYRIPMFFVAIFFSSFSLKSQGGASTAGRPTTFLQRWGGLVRWARWWSARKNDLRTSG